MRREFEFERVGEANVFTFKVDDPRVAKAAILDVPWLYNVVTPANFNESQQTLLTTFVVTGFPHATRDGSYRIELHSGTIGRVGAEYRYSFPFAGRTLNVSTTLTDLTEHGEASTITYSHEIEPERQLSLGPVRCAGPKYPWGNTQTRFEVCRDVSMNWQVKMTHTGPHAKNSIDRLGELNYWINRSYEICSIVVFLPCYWPICPLLLLNNYQDFEVKVHTAAKMRHVADFINGGPRTESLIVPYEQRLSRERRAKRTTVTEEFEPPRKPMMARQAPGSKVEEERSTITPAVRVLEPPQEEGEDTEGTRLYTTGESQTGVSAILEEAIPVATVAETRGSELERWFRLYQSGAISEEEYELEKAKLLREE